MEKALLSDENIFIAKDCVCVCVRACVRVCVCVFLIFLKIFCKNIINSQLTMSQSQTWPQGYKTFFILNSVEHEILNAHKYKDIKKFSFF